MESTYKKGKQGCETREKNADRDRQTEDPVMLNTALTLDFSIT